MISRLPLFGLIGVCLWPVANFASSNYEDLSARGFLSSIWQPFSLMLFILFVLISVSYLAGKLAKSTGQRMATVLTSLVILLFFFAPIQNLTAPLFSSDRAGAILFVPYFFIVVIVLSFVGYVSRWEFARVAVAFFVLIAFLMPGVMLASKLVSGEKSTSQKTVQLPSVTTSLSGENVYYIILDGYAGQAVLKSVFDFDNTAFLNRMKARNFTNISDSWSNFFMTNFTLGGIFMMDYSAEKDMPPTQVLKNAFPAVVNNSKNPPALLQKLREADYDVWHLGNKWVTCNPDIFKCFEKSGPIDYFTNYSTAIFLKPTPFYPLINMAGRKYTRTVLDQMSLSLEKIRPHSRSFLFIHNFQPHPPYIFKKDCQKRTKVDMLDLKGWEPESKQPYLQNLKCISFEVEGLVDQIRQRDPSALIVIQGDHGSAFNMKWRQPMHQWSGRSIEERASMLNLVYAPTPCRKWLRSNLGQINTIRFVLACLAREKPDYVEEKTVLTTYYNQYSIICEWRFGKPYGASNCGPPADTRLP